MGQKTLGKLYCKDCSKNLQKCTCMDDTIDMKVERKYSEEDMKEAYFTAISSTSESWNGKYAGGNYPNIEKKFKEGFELFIEQYKKK